MELGTAAPGLQALNSGLAYAEPAFAQPWPLVRFGGRPVSLRVGFT